MGKKKIEEIIKAMVESYIEDSESTFVIDGDENLAREIEANLKKKAVKMSYVIDGSDLLIEIDPVWVKHFDHDSAASAMLGFREWMQYKMHYRCLTEILYFNICSEHIEKIDILKRVFWYEKIPKKK